MCRRYRHYLETSDLRDYYPEVQATGDWIEAEGKVAAARANGVNVVTFHQPRHSRRYSRVSAVTTKAY